VQGIDRKAIPKDLERSYRDNRGFYTDLRGRALRSKPLLHRDSAIEVVPSPLEASAGTTAAPAPRPAPPPGSGLLALTLDAAATMPVAAVDEVPVAVGDGTVFVVLPAGPHVVDVQGGATGSPVVVDIQDGKAATLVWREEADRQTVRFGPEVVNALPPASRVYLYEWAILVLLICGLPLATVNAFSFDETASRITVAVVVILGLVLFPFAPWRKRERARLAALRLAGEAPVQSRPVHYPWDGPDVADRPALVGDRPESLPAFAPGRGALLLRTRAHRHLWIEGDGVVVRDPELAGLRVPPPTVRIDGLELPATWGNWWYPLAPGPHTVEITVEAPAGGHAAGAAIDAPAADGDYRQPITERLDFAVREGEATALRADAHVPLHRDEDSRRIVGEHGRLYLDPEEFRGEWMGDPAKRLDYWS